MCVCFPFKFELSGELLQFYALHCLWCLILHVSLTGLKDAQMAGKISFLDLSVRVFPEEVSIWICRLSPVWVGIIQSVEGLTRTKRHRNNEFAWIELEHPSFSALRHWWSWFLGPWSCFEFALKQQHWLSKTSNLQRVDGGTSQPPEC